MTGEDVIRWYTDIPLWAAEKVAERMNSLLSEGGGRRYEYADNYRIANAGNAREVKKYKETRSGGCCGSFDRVLFAEEYETREVVAILYGFNYGH